MRLGFREPFADEPFPPSQPPSLPRHYQSSLSRPLLLWQGVEEEGSAGGAEKSQSIIRFQGQKVFIPNEAVQFAIWRLLGSVSFLSCTVITETDSPPRPQTFTKKKLIWKGQRSAPGSSLAHTLEAISGSFDIDADGLWSKKSRLPRALGCRLNRMSCCLFSTGLRATGPASHSELAWRLAETLCVGSEGHADKPVDEAVSGSLSSPQPSATWTTWTSVQQWWYPTGGISPRGAKKRMETELLLLQKKTRSVVM